MVVEGLIIKESLTDDSMLVQLTVLSEESWNVDIRAKHQPNVWTAIIFQVEEEKARAIAEELSKIIKPGWYIDFHSPDTKFVVYKEKIFEYPRDDLKKMEEAQDYGYSQGIPRIQLEWNP